MDTQPFPAGIKKIFVEGPASKTLMVFESVAAFLSPVNFFAATSVHPCGQYTTVSYMPVQPAAWFGAKLALA